MNSQGQDPYKRGSMGSLGGSVAQSVESRGVVSGPSIRQFLNSAGGSASSGSSTNTGGTSVSSSANTSSGVGVANSAAVFSAVAASHANSLLMANSIPAPQQRAVSDMIRQMQGLGQHAFLDRSRNLSGFMGRSYGTSGGGGTGVIGLHSNFGASDSAPPPLDLSEFPSLSSRNTDSSQPNPMAGRQPYVGMVKQPTAETSEFTCIRLCATAIGPLRIPLFI
ncbi:uncharacterized protein LOC143024475 [Oratosquilla oratoria]|uniref:uncharacterized protein LOC143024475 n=1 Tax=Oratosquilla oratoria TaxID=337810 RepID=UPI003F7718C9